jgi:hypothetical protein
MKGGVLFSSLSGEESEEKVKGISEANHMSSRPLPNYGFGDSLDSANATSYSDMGR